MPYPAHTIFNPGATIFENNTLLLARVEDRQGFSHLAKAISKDGVSNWIFDKSPTIHAEPNIYPEELNNIKYIKVKIGTGFKTL